MRVSGYLRNWLAREVRQPARAMWYVGGELFRWRMHPALPFVSLERSEPWGSGGMPPIRTALGLGFQEVGANFQLEMLKDKFVLIA